MAIICREHGLLFIMVPRTGCTAVGEVLRARLGGEYLPVADILDSRGFVVVARKHTTLEQLVTHGFLSPAQRARLLVIACVRNPFDSLVSLYVKKSLSYQRLLDDPTSFVHRIPGYVEDMRWCQDHSFDEWIVKRYAPSVLDRLLGRGRRSMFRRFTDGADVIMRYEQLQQSFDDVLARAGLPPLEIPFINPTVERGREYWRYYTPRSGRIVEYVHQQDCRRYGYRLL